LAASSCSASSDAVRLGIRRAVIKSVVFFALMVVVLLGCAGSVQWLWGWAYLFAAGLLQAGTTILLARFDPALLAERSQLQAGTKKWDVILASIVALLGPLAILVTAGLDYRWGWSPVLPGAVHGAGLLAALAGGALVSVAMLSNHFFASTVRIQTERGHRVIDSGPYAYLRHPGYSGALVFTFASPLILGSWWAMLPAACTVAALLIRTALEDRTLSAELPGYSAYRMRVRARLIPGIW
jgi:protein-S-isoprenylcysteine O-methyltransferase Ste14